MPPRSYNLIPLVAAVTLVATPARSQNPAPPPEIRGFTMSLDTSRTAETYKKAIDDMTNLGSRWLNVVVFAEQDTVRSETMKVDPAHLPSTREIESIINHAKARGMHVMIMPIVAVHEVLPGKWRGTIEPPSWDNWFFSYTLYIKQFALLAAKTKCDLFCVGSELLSTERDREHWLKVIADVKDIFPGKLTYSANWDHYTVPTFWDKLDYIGMNNYNELAKAPGATPTQLRAAWQPIRDNALAYGKKRGKPMLFTEMGWHNMQNTIPEPWNYATADYPIDPSEQLHAYQSFVEAWKGLPPDAFAGAFIWEWKPNAIPTEPNYSLQGEPALAVVQKWLTENQPNPLPKTH